MVDLENQVTALRMRVAELEDELNATQFALQKSVSEAQRPTTNPNLPAVRATGQAVTIWRRGRI